MTTVSIKKIFVQLEHEKSDIKHREIYRRLMSSSVECRTKYWE